MYETNIIRQRTSYFVFPHHTPLYYQSYNTFHDVHIIQDASIFIWPRPVPAHVKVEEKKNHFSSSSFSSICLSWHRGSSRMQRKKNTLHDADTPQTQRFNRNGEKNKIQQIKDENCLNKSAKPGDICAMMKRNMVNINNHTYTLTDTILS